MAKLTLTPQQQAVVENRGGSLLVSAAAGSGKTKVLVDRLFRYVTEERCNIDDFLIITYTKAAAAELRSKIASELSKRLGQTPGDQQLRRQLLRVYQADIKTVDAFCTALLRENTHLLAQEGERYTLTPDFRVLDENDAKLLRQRVLTRVLERFYEELDEGGALLADTLGAGRDDSALEDLVLETYEKLQSHADPEHWLAENRTIWENRSGDFDETPYAAELLAVIRQKGFHYMEALRRAGQSTVGGDLYKGYGEKFLRASRSFAPLAAAQNWEAARVSLDGLEFPRLTTPKGMADDPEIVRLKGLWENAKTAAKKLAPMLAVSDTEAMEDHGPCHDSPFEADGRLFRRLPDGKAADELRRLLRSGASGPSPAGGAERRAYGTGPSGGGPLPGDPGGRVSGYQRGAERHFPGGVP